MILERKGNLGLTTLLTFISELLVYSLYALMCAMPVDARLICSICCSALSLRMTNY